MTPLQVVGTYLGLILIAGVFIAVPLYVVVGPFIRRLRRPS